MRALIGTCLCVALAMVGAGCQSGSTTAAALKVGDCFDVASTTDPDSGNSTINVLTDCAKPHDA